MISETPVFCDGGLFMIKKHSDKVISAVFTGALLLIWELCVRIFRIPLYVLPSPVSVVQALIEERVGLWGHAVVTTEEALGLFSGGASGIISDSGGDPDGADDRDGSDFDHLYGIWHAAEDFYGCAYVLFSGGSQLCGRAGKSRQ